MFKYALSSNFYLIGFALIQNGENETIRLLHKTIEQYKFLNSAPNLQQFHIDLWIHDRFNYFFLTHIRKSELANNQNEKPFNRKSSSALDDSLRHSIRNE